MRARWLLALAVPGLLAAGWWMIKLQLTRGEVFTVARGDVDETLYVPGWVEPAGGIVEVSTSTRGVITSLSVQVGDTVTAGQVVATLDAEEAVARVAQAEAMVSQTEANAAALRALFRELEQGDSGSKSGGTAGPASGAPASGGIATVSPASGAPDAASPASGGTASAPAGESAKNGGSVAQVASAKSSGSVDAQAQALLNQLGVGTKGGAATSPRSRREALSAAQAAVAGARATLAQAEAEKGKTIVRAPVAGTVVECNVHAGELVGGPGPAPLLTIADLSRLQVRLELDEADLTRVHNGQTGYVTSLATGDLKMPGAVTRMGYELGRRKVPLDDPRARTDTRVLEVVMGLDHPGPLRLRQRVEAAIVLSSVKGVLTIPVKGVYHDNGRAYVRTSETFTTRELPVTLGVSNGALVEVKQGLTGGEQLVMDPAFR